MLHIYGLYNLIFVYSALEIVLLIVIMTEGFISHTFLVYKEKTPI